MKNIILALTIVFGIAALLIAGLSYFEFTRDMVKQVVGPLIAAIPLVHQLLQKRGSDLSLSPAKRGVVSRSGYSMPWYFLALYGAMILIGVSQLVSGFAGVVAALADLQRSQFIYIAAVASIPTMICSYLVGAWIGARCQTKGLLAVWIAAMAVPLFDRALVFLLMDPAQVAELFGNSNMMVVLLQAILIGGLLFGVSGSIGYWRGRKAQLSRYLGYLLRALPQESKDTLVNIAYDEAKRLDPHHGEPRLSPA